MNDIFLDQKIRSLEGKKGLVVGIANEDSLAYGCAKAFRGFGAELAITYLNDKAKLFVGPLASELDASILMPLDVEREGQMEAVFAAGATVGQARLCPPFDRVCSQIGSAWTCCRLFA
jgi:enoyl-[acyl-carrier protein] reductase I